MIGSGSQPSVAVRLVMRAILGISLVLVGVGMFSCQLEGVSSPPVTYPTGPAWVRTVDGWERPGTWQFDVALPPPPRLHPLLVAAGQGLGSVLGLVACGRKAA